MKKISVLFLVAGLFCFVSSCKKVEGEGGSSKIVGKVTVKNYNVGGSILEGTYPGRETPIITTESRRVMMAHLNFPICSREPTQSMYMKMSFPNRPMQITSRWYF
jgi:hypothetical protein